MRFSYALAGLLLVACGHTREPSRAAAPGVANAATITYAADAPPRGGRHVEDPSSVKPVQIEVQQVEGATATELRSILRPALEPVRRCVAGSGGKLEVQLTNRRGALEVDARLGESLDPALRSCVLAALTTVYLEASGSNAGGPGVPASSFTSLVTVSW
jgi:hypothetical protein